MKSRNIEQGELYLSSFDQSSQDFAFVSAERDKFAVKNSVVQLYLPWQSVLGMLPISEQPARSDIVGEDGKQQGIFS